MGVPPALFISTSHTPGGVHFDWRCCIREYRVVVRGHASDRIARMADREHRVYLSPPSRTDHTKLPVQTRKECQRVRVSAGWDE